MNELDRFISSEGDTVRFESQCVRCLNKKEKLKCKIFGLRPQLYLMASLNTPCPKRKEVIE